MAAYLSQWQGGPGSSAFWRRERACIMAFDRVLTADAFFEECEFPLPTDSSGATLPKYMAQVEREYLMRALARCGNHKGKTAIELGISRKNLWEKMRKLGLRSESEVDV